MKKLSQALLLCSFVFTACYFSNITIQPSPGAFHNVNSSPFGSQRISGMAANGSMIVAVSAGGIIAYSEDHGETWDTVNSMNDELPGGIQFNDVTWGEGFFFAGGNSGKAAYSHDGKNWYAGVIGPMNPKNILAVAAGALKGQKVFVAAGTDGRIAYALNSPSGPWFQVSFSPFGELSDGPDKPGEAINSLAYGKVQGIGVFVAAGDGGHIAIMKDFTGVFYGPSSAGTLEAFRAVCFGNDRFIAVGDGALIKISADPKSYSWGTIREVGFGMMPFVNIDYYPGLNFFVLIGDESTVGYSVNGESWSAANFSGRFPSGISAIVCTKKKIVLGGADGTILFSN